MFTISQMWYNWDQTWERDYNAILLFTDDFALKALSGCSGKELCKHHSTQGASSVMKPWAVWDTGLEWDLKQSSFSVNPVQPRILPLVKNCPTMQSWRSPPTTTIQPSLSWNQIPEFCSWTTEMDNAHTHGKSTSFDWISISAWYRWPQSENKRWLQKSIICDCFCQNLSACAFHLSSHPFCAL